MAPLIVNTILGKIASPLHSYDQRSIPGNFPKVTHYCDCLVLNSQGELLLLQRGTDTEIGPRKWCLPGGHLDPNENLETAAFRECVEETNLELPIPLTLLCSFINDGGSVSHYFNSCCLKDSESMNLILDHTEHYNYKWVSIFDVMLMDKDELLFNLHDRLTNTPIISNYLLLNYVPIHYSVEEYTLTPEEQTAVNYTGEDSLATPLNLYRSMFNKGMIEEEDFHHLYHNIEKAKQSDKLVKFVVTDKEGKLSNVWKKESSLQEDNPLKEDRVSEERSYPYSEEQLGDFARHCSTGTLNQLLLSSHHPEERKAAARELKRRKDHENIHEKEDKKPTK